MRRPSMSESGGLPIVCGKSSLVLSRNSKISVPEDFGKGYLDDKKVVVYATHFEINFANRVVHFGLFPQGLNSVGAFQFIGAKSESIIQVITFHVIEDIIFDRRSQKRIFVEAHYVFVLAAHGFLIMFEKGPNINGKKMNHSSVTFAE